MANFTTGVIDLSANNTFDNVIMGVGDTMTFSNAGTGGAAGAPILVTGDFTVTGGTITLRNATNLTPGSVSVVGIVRDLDAAALNYGTPGSQGSGSFSNPSQFKGGLGGSGGTSGVGNTGGDGFGCAVSPTGTGGTGGIYPNGTGGYGGTGNAICGSYNASVGGGGGGGGAGTHGASSENISFYVQGNISITGGTITGSGGNAATNGGAGGHGGNATWVGGGGGGGVGGSGGHSGNLYLYHLGTAAEAFSTKTLIGGTAKLGGAGGLHGISGSEPNATDGGAGGAGVVGNAGIVELIEVDTTAQLLTNSITEIFSVQALADGTVENDGGNTVTERGFVWATSVDPTTADTKVVVSGTVGNYTGTLIGLTAETTHHARAFATNSEGTAYGADISFKTQPAFIPYTIESL